MRIVILGFFLSTTAFSMNFTRVTLEEVSNPKQQILNENRKIEGLETKTKKRAPASIKVERKTVQVTRLRDTFK